MGRVRLKDVAERAKVDPSTASRVLSGRVGPGQGRDRRAGARGQPRARLHAQRLRPRPANAAHRQHRRRAARSSPTPSTRPVIDGIEERAAQLGLSVVIDAIRPASRRLRPAGVREPRRRAAVLGRLRPVDGTRRARRRPAVPYVLVNRAVAEAPRVGGARRGVGRRGGGAAVWPTPGTRASPTSPGRPTSTPPGGAGSGFCKAMKQLGLRGRPAAGGVGVRAGDRSGGDRWRCSPSTRRPTAICAWTIKSALGVLHALHEHVGARSRSECR